jgi:hypothetical protein
VIKLRPDATPPTVVTISPNVLGPTNAESVEFEIAFDEAVENFDAASDVVVTHTGITHTGVTIVAQNSAVYTATVTGIAGDGTLSLSVNATSDVQDTTGNALNTSISSAPVVIDNTPPTIAVTGDSNFAISDTALYADDGATASDNYDGNLTSQIYTLNGVVSFVPGVYSVRYDVTDAAGNAATTALRTVTVVLRPPFVSQIARQDSTSPDPTTVSFTVLFIEPVVNVDPSDFIVAHTGTEHDNLTVEGNGHAYTLTITGISGVGSFTVAVDLGSDIQDLDGNALVATRTSDAVAVEDDGPSEDPHDVDRDGQVNVVDLQYIIAVIIEAPGADAYGGDVNQDGQTNIVDLFEVVNIILQKD